MGQTTELLKRLFLEEWKALLLANPPIHGLFSAAAHSRTGAAGHEWGADQTG